MTPTGAWGVDALYVHVPFCEHRCAYCDFASVGGLGGHEAYVTALRTEIRTVASRLPGTVLRTVFIGGGTPSLLPPLLLAGILEEVAAGFDLAPGAEVTMEANPSSVAPDRIEQWLAAGVNRVSLGIQSLHPPTLRFLERVHDAPRALAALRELRTGGVPRASADLIYAVPTLDDAAWSDTLDRVLATGVRHVSAYELTVEASTPLGRAVAAGRRPDVDVERALAQHRMLLAAARAAGLPQYEVSNYAVPGEECRHNETYWANGWWLACGVGAHGHLPGAAAAALGAGAAPGPGAALRYWHHRAPGAYRSAVAADPATPFAGSEWVGPDAAATERILVGLRRAAGVALPPAAMGEAQTLADAGLLVLRGPVARTTDRGQEVLDAIAVRLAQALDGAPECGRTGSSTASTEPAWVAAR